ncbi:MAG TPA: rhomboid family intramembrane serine protease, partial [Opitutaceae bacterium]
MNGYDSYSEYQPRGYIGGYPVYTAYVIVAIYTVSMIVSAIMSFAASSMWYAPLVFDSSRVLGGEVWRVLTYGLVNKPSLWFVFDMYMLATFGREIERYFGHKIFLRLWVYLYLLTPLLFTVIGLRMPLRLAGETGSFAMFIAFATLYPNAVMMFNVLAKWAAIILVGICALIDLSDQDSVGLISLLVTTGFAFAYVRGAQGRLALPSLRLPTRKPKLRVLPDPISRSGSNDPETVAEMDELLDKIAKSGLSSLSAK